MKMNSFGLESRYRKPARLAELGFPLFVLTSAVSGVALWRAAGWL